MDDSFTLLSQFSSQVVNILSKFVKYFYSFSITCCYWPIATRAAQLKGASKSLNYAKDVEKIINAAEELSLGPDENEYCELSDRLSQAAQPAGEEHEESPASLGKAEPCVVVDEDNIVEVSGIRDQLNNSSRDVSTTQYLPCMLHVHSPPGILPRYPSWSLVCLGSSSLYSHNAGTTENCFSFAD